MKNDSGSQPTADKQFGQHFLVNQGVIDRIADSVKRQQEKNDSSVVEIGPGPGALTKALLERKFKLFAVELDPRMVEFLEAEYSEVIAAGEFTLCSADAMKVEWGEAPLSESKNICGNLPYNVGTAIIFRLLEFNPVAESFCFMLQKEVVQRFLAVPRTKDYGVPSIMLQLLCDCGEHFWVQPGSFNPPPKVQSGVMSFRRKKELLDELLSPFHPQTEYFSFNKSVKKAFQTRRKMLRKVFPALKETEWGTKRPEELSPETWWQLWKERLLQ